MASSIFRDVIQDGLTSRVGVAKVFWDVRYEDELSDFDSLTQDELDMLLAEDGVELEESEVNELGLISGTISKQVDKSQVCIETVPPEQF